MPLRFWLVTPKFRDKPFSAAPPRNGKPKKIDRQTTTYEGDPEIVAYVLQLADGKCDCREVEAPFIKPDGSLYLEVHHLRRLADGGSDTVTNAVAICPNGHRELHYGAEQNQQMQRLYRKVLRLAPE